MRQLTELSLVAQPDPEERWGASVYQRADSPSQYLS